MDGLIALLNDLICHHYPRLLLTIVTLGLCSPIRRRLTGIGIPIITVAYHVAELGKCVAQTGRSNGDPVNRDPHCQLQVEFGDDVLLPLWCTCVKRMVPLSNTIPQYMCSSNIVDMYRMFLPVKKYPLPLKRYVAVGDNVCFLSVCISLSLIFYCELQGRCDSWLPLTMSSCCTMKYNRSVGNNPFWFSSDA